MVEEKSLKLQIFSNKATNWMVITNRLHERQAEAVYPRWNGVLFCITDEYELFKGNKWERGLEHLELSDASGVSISKITAQQFRDGEFLYIAFGSGADGGNGPSTTPAADARQLWCDSLSKHVRACNGGVILWKHRDEVVTFVMGNESDPNHAMYELALETKQPLVIRHYKKDGVVLEDYSNKGVETISFTAIDDPDPKDPINPPRYP